MTDADDPPPTNEISTTRQSALLRNLDDDTWSVCTVATVEQDLWTNEDVPEPCSEVPTIPFTVEDHKDLFHHRTYVIHSQIGLGSTSQQTQLTTMDTGCGPNLVGKDVLPQKWHDRIQQCDAPSLTSASGTALDLLGVIPLYVTIGQLRVRI